MGASVRSFRVRRVVRAAMGNGAAERPADPFGTATDDPSDGDGARAVPLQIRLLGGKSAGRQPAAPFISKTSRLARGFQGTKSTDK